MSRPILIAGPTASGKSSLALAIADRTGARIVNADAIQVYGCWQVLTARPDAADEARAKHFLYGHVDAQTPYSVGQWLKEVAAEIDDGPVIIVGGTGLYFSALTQGLAEIPPISAEVRAEGNALRAAGLADLRRALAAIDPKGLANLDENNPARLQRAWEVATETETSITVWQARTGPPVLPLSDCQAIVLHSQTEWLDARIAARFSAMLQNGAVEEVQAWRQAGYDLGWPSGKALGARELLAHLDGEMTLQEVENAVYLATRRFAKRQRSWFRSRFADWRWIDIDDHTDLQELAGELVPDAAQS